ncbi:MAG: alpha/beta hydrolase fold domain-containing protein [Planctomycetaceae bacterium]|nr:alpha/beta hydrolase fold domain-containing protein [Planctomycetaceae bacterium]
MRSVFVCSCRSLFFCGLFLLGCLYQPQTGFSQSPTEQAGRAQFDRMDRNQDGRLTPDEIPVRSKGLFRKIDTNGDSLISLEEHLRFVNLRAVRQPRGNQQPDRRLPEGVEVSRDVFYVKDGHARQTLDVYVPAQTDAKLPVVVWIHGGAWRAGDKRNCPALYLLKHGYVVASINYRLSQHAVFPAQIQDCKAAIRFLKSNADRFQIDPKKVGVWGSSAGGHLVALLGTSGGVVELELPGAEKSEFDSTVQAVCDYFGPTDFTQMNEQTTIKGPIDHDAVDSPESQLIGGAVQKNKEKAEAASPLSYVSKNDPPFLIVHGDRDPLVPLPQSEILQKKLKATGVNSELIIIPGGGHGPFKSPERLEQVQRFFDKHLKR